MRGFISHIRQLSCSEGMKHSQRAEKRENVVAETWHKTKRHHKRIFSFMMWHPWPCDMAPVLWLTVGEGWRRTIAENCQSMWKVNWLTWHQRGTKKKIWVPVRNRTHGLPNRWWALYPLSYKKSWRAKSFNWVHVTGILHSARISTVEFIVNNDKWKKMVHFTLGNALNTVEPHIKWIKGESF